MKQSEIRFSIELDKEKVPEKIFWNATENPSGGLEETQAIAVSVWDPQNQQTLRIDLWTKQMDVIAMKHFSIDTIGGLAKTILSATDDEFMAREMHALCVRLAEHVEKQEKEGL
ncbi:MAG: gliding motility protein GldC [Bernardetiaceae bacterium]|nr:gliding motility protein GldC [Bernardetiaceae bacterium]